MNMTRLSLIAAATLGLLTTSCASRKAAQVTPTDDVATRQNPSADFDRAFGVDPQDAPITRFAAANNDFAFHLFNDVRGFDSKVVSPLSVSYLMAMLANGADGTTRTQIMKAIACSGLTVEQLNGACHALMTPDPDADPDSLETVSIANYIALNKGYELRPAFASTIRTDYDGEVDAFDFRSADALGRINGWCSRHTGGMIPKFLDRIEPSLMSYVLNAVYFNGTWANKFMPAQTKLEAFRGYTRDRKMVQMMHQEEKFDIYEGKDYSAISLPYGAYNHTMTILLPAEGKSIDQMMAKLTPAVLAKLPSQMERCIVDLKLPRFSTETEQPLNEAIARLGAPLMFQSDAANFSLLADGNFYVSQMKQKAKIEVTEEGTRAAAITGAWVATTALAPEPRHTAFHADRPFAYVITERRTGAILFMGQFTGSGM